jgi:hypothetical protein
MCKAIINISIVTHMLEESFKRLGSVFLQANLIKVSPFQAGKNSQTQTKLAQHSIATSGDGTTQHSPMDWDDALTESRLSHRPCPLFIGERRSKE